MQRHVHLDYFAGILIVYMIINHVEGVTYDFLFSKYTGRFLFILMPWFFFKSGMFHKNVTIEKTFNKGLKRLIVPFCSFTIIGWTFKSVEHLLKGDYDIFSILLKPIAQILFLGSSEGNWPLWFLLSLFFVKLLFAYTSNKHLLYILITISLILPYLFYHWKIGKFLYVPNTLNGVLFYYFGILFRERQYKKSIWFISIFLFFIFLCLYPSNIDIHKNKLLFGNYYLWIIYSLVGIISFNGLFNTFFEKIKIIPFKSILCNLGKDSMTYYVIHWILITLGSIICIIFHVDNKCFHLILTLLLCLTMLPLINYHIKKSKYKYIIGI